MLRTRIQIDNPVNNFWDMITPWDKNFHRMSMVAGATILFLTACRPSTNMAKEVCEDFLETWGTKPAELAFTQCKRIENPQFDRLESSYVVAGADGSYTDKEGYYFHISMGSDETLLRDRQNWPNISQFHVRVTKYLGSP